MSAAIEVGEVAEDKKKDVEVEAEKPIDPTDDPPLQSEGNEEKPGEKR